MSKAPELRALGVGEILDVSIKLSLRHFLTFVKIVAVVIIPVGVVNLLILTSTLPDGAVANEGQLLLPPVNETGIGRFATGTVISAVLSTMAGLVATGAIFKALSNAYLSKAPKAGASLRFGFTRIHSLLWVSILIAIVVVVGLVLLIVPGIYLGVAFAVVIPALMLENHRGTAALRRSFRLVKGRWWPSFGVVIVGWFLIPVIAALIVGLIFEVALMASADSPTAILSLTTVSNSIATVITTPFQAAAITVLYFDLLVRKEGFDLQLLAARIDEQAQPTQAERGGPGTSS